MKFIKAIVFLVIALALGATALAIFFPQIWNRFKNESEAAMQATHLSSSFVPPKDGKWNSNDWPRRSFEGWSPVSSEVPVIKTNELVDRTWASKMYTFDEEEGDSPTMITIHIRPVDEASKTSIQEAVDNFNLPDATADPIGVNIGPRISQTVTTENATRSYELWVLGDEKNWMLLVEGADDSLVKKAAQDFLEGLKPEHGYKID